MVYIKYCDGATHLGYQKEPYIVNDTKIYFRGVNNTIAAFDWLIENKGLLQSEQVIIAGASAGGLATFYWTNYLRNLLNVETKLWAVPDSGFFLNREVSTPIEIASNIEYMQLIS